ncbi:MAG: hypothetical protein EBS34_09230, partial [Flavobacteriales bacterium]|nr:hypothetical protein [Flavobacteriales bacterium]
MSHVVNSFMKTFFFMFGLLVISGQNLAQSINEIEKRANQAFDSKKYNAAKTDFQILFSRDPKSPTYNFKFACCLYFTNEKNASFNHFELAAKLAPGICEANYYLGKLYHLNYDFKRAVSAFNAYLACFPSDELQAQKEIAYCRNAESLMIQQQTMSVLNSQQLPLSGFLSRIEFDQIGIGGGYYTDLSLQSKSDKAKGFIPHTYVKAGNKVKIFPSYGSDMSHTSLFIMRKSGEDWSKPIRIPLDAGANMDILYPFFDAASETLYFSSNGFNSLGGFDFFKMKFNPETMQIGEIENVGFPFSSTDDEYLFIPVNTDGTQAYFATGRSAQIGKIDWVQGKLEKVNANIVLLQGRFKDYVNPKNTQIQVKVKNTKDGLEYGPFVSDSLGNYVLMLPGAGRYEFTATIPGTQQVFKDTKDLPQHTSNQAILQTINHDLIETKESTNFDYQFSQMASEELKIQRNMKLAALSKEFNPIPSANKSKDPSSATLAEDKLNAWGFSQGNILQQSDALADRL